jgi:hypothetical protein
MRREAGGKHGRAIRSDRWEALPKRSGVVQVRRKKQLEG